MMKWYTGNLVDQATFTPSTENLQFPSSNLQDPRRTKVFRSTTNADTLILDFQETSLIDTIFVVDEPRNGFGISSLSFDLNATSNFTSPAFSDVITLDTVFGVGIKTFTEQSYRFARLNITSTLGYCELSKIFIGKELDVGRGPNFGWTYQLKELSNVKENRYGQKFVDVISRQKQFGLQMSLLDKDQLDKIFQIYDERGTTKPFFIQIGCADMINNTNRFASMVYMTAAPTITNSSFGRYGLSVTLEEAM